MERLECIDDADEWVSPLRGYVPDPEEETTKGRVLGFMDWLQIVFIVLKLFGVIEWSWWWVMSPFIAHITLVSSVVVLLWFALLGMATRRR